MFYIVLLCHLLIITNSQAALGTSTDEICGAEFAQIHLYQDNISEVAGVQPIEQFTHFTGGENGGYYPRQTEGTIYGGCLNTVQEATSTCLQINACVAINYFAEDDCYEMVLNTDQPEFHGVVQVELSPNSSTTEFHNHLAEQVFSSCESSNSRLCTYEDLCPRDTDEKLSLLNYDYYRKIKYPMDISTIIQKLKDNKYEKL